MTWTDKENNTLLEEDLRYYIVYYSQSVGPLFAGEFLVSLQMQTLGLDINPSQFQSLGVASKTCIANQLLKLM